MKRCEKCKESFSPKTPNARFCSITCRNRANAKNSNINRNYGTGTCEVCKKDFVMRAKHARFCSNECHSRYFYLKFIDKRKERDRIKIKKTTIGLNIRDAHLQTPTPDAKWLWDGIGRWSVKYPDITECLECNTNVYNHVGNGICAYCFNKLKWRDEERLKEYKRKKYQEQKAAGKPFSAQVAREWVSKARNKEIPVTPTIENLLHNHDNL